ncbi:MAG: ABC transporter ATP-binding protein [Phycisphaeraceae bacterium]
MVAVRINHLVKRFGATVAVNDVSLEIGQGELFFLLGPSGCGKTTLLRMIAGLTDVNGGSITFGERDITHLPTGRRNAAMVFQSYALWPHLTVAQNVAFGLDVRNVGVDEKRRRVADALAMVRMAELADRRPVQLSGGQQQRVALARALIVNPDVLLLDEPLSNLDAKLRLEMRAEIRRICKTTGITTIYVTHDQEEALSMADRIALMKDGKLMQIGPPPEVYNRPRNRFVADFLGTTNFIPAVVRERQDDALVLETATGTLRSLVYPADVPGKGNVTCSVRPEAMRLIDAGQSAQNVLSANHVETMYLGDLAQHTFSTSDGLRIYVTEPKPRLREWNAPVRIGFDAEDVVVLTN